MSGEMHVQKSDQITTFVSRQKSYIVNHVNAFVNSQGKHGNPAGVILLDNEFNFPLPDDIMVDIARQVGYPETAFAKLCSREGTGFDVDVRFATPASANGFCGHATVATIGLLFSNQLISGNGTIYMRTTVLGENSPIPELCIIPITCSNALVEMQQNLPIFHITLDPLQLKNRILNSLELPLSNFLHDIEIVNTGGKDAIVVFKEKSVLDNVHLTDEICQKISEVSRCYNIVGYHLFAKDCLSYDMVADINDKINVQVTGVRNFAPLEDIPEEAATGSANGAMACYIVKNILSPLLKTDHFDKPRNRVKIKFEIDQGQKMGCPSNIFVDVCFDQMLNEFVSVKVSGRFKENSLKRNSIYI